MSALRVWVRLWFARGLHKALEAEAYERGRHDRAKGYEWARGFSDGGCPVSAAKLVYVGYVVLGPGESDVVQVVATTLEGAMAEVERSLATDEVEHNKDWLTILPHLWRLECGNDGEAVAYVEQHKLVEG